VSKESDAFDGMPLIGRPLACVRNAAIGSTAHGFWLLDLINEIAFNLIASDWHS
jgi:hypothetical protein